MSRWLARAHRWPHPDFLPPQRRVPWVRWTALGTAAMACAFAVNDWRALHQAAEHEHDTLAHWRSESAKRLSPRSAPVVADERARLAAERMAASLTHPWPQLFSAVERATPASVHWLALSHAPGESTLRLEGEASNPAQALAAVDRLAMEPGLSAVVLTRLAVGSGGGMEKGLGSTPLRFEITARVDVGTLVKGAS